LAPEKEPSVRRDCFSCDNARGSSRCLRNETAAARTFKLPVPAETIPSEGKNELLICITARTSNGVSFGCSSSTNATAPLTIAAAMLVPDSSM
jgi:hypothetical protein